MKRFSNFHVVYFSWPTWQCLATAGSEHGLPSSRPRCLECHHELNQVTGTAATRDGHHHHHLSLNREGRLGTTDDFATSSLHFPLFSTDFWDLANSRPVHSLMLSSNLFLYSPCLLPAFIVPCKMVLARLDERET